MQRGYVKLWRCSVDAGWLQNHKLWAFWCWCLMKATHKEYDQVVGCQVVHLFPGEFVFGRKKAAEELRVSEQEIRTMVDSMRKRKNLTIKTTNKYSIITIINWPTYQGDETVDQPANQPTTNQQLTTYKHINNKTFLSDSTELGLAELLFQKIRSRNQKHKRPNLQTWARDVDKMIRIDGRTADDIRTLIEWSQQDPFWQNNILSTAKLREKFDQLILKMGPRVTAGDAGSWFKTSEAYHG